MRALRFALKMIRALAMSPDVVASAREVDRRLFEIALDAIERTADFCHARPNDEKRAIAAEHVKRVCQQLGREVSDRLVNRAIELAMEKAIRK